MLDVRNPVEGKGDISSTCWELGKRGARKCKNLNHQILLGEDSTNPSRVNIELKILIATPPSQWFS